jgi:hypothetical protein
MKDLGTIAPGSTIYIEFDSFGADGQSLTLSGLAVTDVEVYKDGGVTQRSSDAGYTLLDTDGIDFDGVTGIHGLSINLADNTDAGFWAAGSHYRVVIASVTINTQTVSFTAATFRIGYEGSVLNTTIATLASQTSFTLTTGPAEDDALNNCRVLIHDVASAVQKGFAVVSDYTGATKTVTLTAGTTFTAAATDNISFFPSVNVSHVNSSAATATAGAIEVDVVKWNGTSIPAVHTAGYPIVTIKDGTGTGEINTNAGAVANVDLVATLTTYTGNTVQTGDSYALANGANGFVAIKADTAAILVDTGTDIPATLVTIAGYIDTEVASILAAVDTELAALITTVGVAGAGLTDLGGMSTTMKAQVNTEADTALSDVGVTLARMGALTDWIDGGRLDLLLDGVVADNPNRPTRAVELANVVFTMVDATDFNTPETGVTVTATISKDGGAFAACTNAASEISSGFYKITLTATEMTADAVALKFTGTGCAQRNFSFRTQPT